MTAGLLLTGRVWRFSNLSGGLSTDDRVGGSVPTGTVAYETVYARISAEQPTQALLEQGLETPTIFSATISPGTVTFEHNDQLEITGPALSPYNGKRFRVIGVQNSSMIDPRRFITVTLRRVEQARSNAYQ